MLEIGSSKLWIINFYQEQLSKFTKLGLGRRTENDVIITEQLIETTRKRLHKLSVVYDRSLTPQAHKLRQLSKEYYNN
mgnify:FL=1